MHGGIDGCRNGWILAILDQQMKLSLHHLTELNMINDLEQFERIYIDIPLHFAQTSYRKSELKARKLLNKRAHSIFLSPNFAALQQETYTQACELNYQIMGKKISIQYWNIKHKIIEAQAFYQNKTKNILFESHPELAFLLLNSGILPPSKKTQAGLTIRLEQLMQFVPNAEIHIQNMLSKRKKGTDFGPDDLLDAIILALSAAQKHQMQLTSQSNNDKMMFGTF